MQEFLPKLYQGTPKTFVLGNLAQNQRVYQILKVNVEFGQICKTKTDLREALVEFTQNHFLQEFLHKLCQKTNKT